MTEATENMKVYKAYADTYRVTPHTYKALEVLRQDTPFFCVSILESCGCARGIVNRQFVLPPGQANSHAVLRIAKTGATKRNLDWLITDEHALHIMSQDCHYCGIKPSQEYRHKRSNGGFIYNGIDRVDNSKGYIVGNVVACCGNCNKAKGTMQIEEFRWWIIQVNNHWANKETS